MVRLAETMSVPSGVRMTELEKTMSAMTGQNLQLLVAWIWFKEMCGKMMQTPVMKEA